jgi:hypothetical protein
MTMQTEVPQDDPELYRDDNNAAWGGSPITPQHILYVDSIYSF